MDYICVIIFHVPKDFVGKNTCTYTNGYKISKF